MTDTYDRYRRDLWCGRAEAYRRSVESLCAHPVPQLLDATGVGPGTAVLDAGCGTGSLAEAAAARGARVTAVDAEPSMVAAVAGRVPQATATTGVLPDLPVPSGAFDAVLANFVVNHVARPAATVTELRRVTRPGGRVGVTVWPQPVPPLQHLWDDVIAAAAVTRPPTPVLAPDDDFPRTAAGLAGLLADAGLLDVRSRLVEWDHRVDPEQWWAGAADGIATIGHVIRHQDGPTVRRMKGQYDRLVAPHLDGAGMLVLPTAAVLATATAP